ncbi:KICSTOR complex protein SZT2 isoform X2 [Protopterus annectens]|uniref:KICSTOR complex protein SZT2 isoform X2 n=1 Tax=Protopterus annectens TaxID=7888 RepID=UPI001CF9AE3D|nr:KICSTOR complex protein SZT2 isoform X2 [Protopterus annectens]
MRDLPAEVEEAGQVFLLLKKEYRISRNVRLAWVLNNLNQIIRPASQSELNNSDNEVDVLSILPKGWQPEEPVSQPYYLMVPSTKVTFVSWQYRFVIELDLSPSTGIVDDSTGEMIFDEVFHALSRCLVGLVRPFKIPGSDIVFRPEIFVTILAYSSIIELQSHQVLVQGCWLEESSLEDFFHHIHHQLSVFENKAADILQQQYEMKEQVDTSGVNRNCRSDTEEYCTRKLGVSLATADIGLVSMIRQGILALQLLPANSSAGIIIITDGVTSVPDITVCETLLNQLRGGTVACSFIQVGGVYSYDCSFGYVPDVELMKFISMATFGSYMSACPEIDQSCLDLNVYHKAFLLYSFLRTGESLNPEYYCVSQHKLFNEHLVSASSNPALAMRRKKHTEKEVHASLLSVVSVRLREGYGIREINITKGGTQLEMKLVLLWKHNMRIEYLVTSSWPLDLAKRSTWVEVTMEGSYDMLHDISCTMRKPITSMYRTSVIRRFWNTLQSINQTDQMLVHLQSFNSVPEHYTVPESTKNGVPLFYIPPGSATPVLSLQQGGPKDSSQSQFSCYWKPILSMDANFWQKWLHMHRIVLILEHDTPVPKHLHAPGSNGRYSTVLCRISHSSLTSLLRDWSSFVLVEGYSYVKLLHSSTEQTPSSFYLIRIISKPPCMVLRLGFPIGTPAVTRNKIVDELREQILLLRFPHRVQSKEATPKVKRKVLGTASPSKSPPLPLPQPAFSDRPCVVIFSKPLEKLLIRYEKLPSDYRTPFILSLENLGQPHAISGPLTVAANRTASSTLASLSRYFFHQRWIWSVHSGLAPAVPNTAVAQILATITEIRLSEGFHFASSGEGIVNMVLEVPMKSNFSSENDGKMQSCLIQYILFPPHCISTKDSFSTDDDNDTEVEAIEVDMELNLVTECWVEPQNGQVVSSSENLRHLHGLSYLEIPKEIYPRDLACMTTMLTFEYLSYLCQNKDHISPICGTKGSEGVTMAHSEYIHEIPFQFDFMKLLSKCQQTEIFFLAFSKDQDEKDQESSSLPSDILLSLFHTCLQQDLSDREIPLSDSDHVIFMQQVLQRDRDGHLLPFTLPVIREVPFKLSDPLQRIDSALPSHVIGSSKEVTGSTSTLQSVGNTEEDAVPEDRGSVPQWRCYVKSVNPQQIFLTFIPSTFADVQKLLTSAPQNGTRTNEIEIEEHHALESFESVLNDPSDCTEKRSEPEWIQEEKEATDCQETGRNIFQDGLPLSSSSREDPSKGSCLAVSPTQKETLLSREPDQVKQDSLPPADSGLDQREFSGLLKKEIHITFGRQASHVDTTDHNRPCFPVYVYNCSQDLLREQLVNPPVERSTKDIFFRSLSVDRISNSVLTDLMTHHHRHKELANHCSLLQEHYHQCYVKAVFRSLQQTCSVSSQDLLTAMDYCEEVLQEINITGFLQTLCGHIRAFRDRQEFQVEDEMDLNSATFVIGSVEQQEERAQLTRGVLSSVSSQETEDYSELEARSPPSAATSPVIAEEPKVRKTLAEFPLSLLQSSQTCEVFPNLHKIIQDKFLQIGGEYFKVVPSNSHYFFYCPPSAKKEEDSAREDTDRKPSEEFDISEADLGTEEGNVSGCCIATESDPDLEVEYREKSDRECQASDSGSDSNTMNQDDDSFSVLGGDSLNEQDVSDQETPPLFVHLTCSVKLKNCHGSMPVDSLPTCLGEVIGCLDNCQTITSIDLNHLNVTLDIFVLTLPIDIDVMVSDIHHNRYTSEGSVCLNRSQGQPSSYRSDDGILQNMDQLPSTGDVSSAFDPLSRLPAVHKQAVEATMSEIRWLLEDEIVSALCHSSVITTSTLRKVADHVCKSQGRQHCHSEVVPLQFVFGPEQSLEKFKEEFRKMNLTGYILNAAESNYYYLSLSRQHTHKVEAVRCVAECSSSNVNEGTDHSYVEEFQTLNESRGIENKSDGQNEVQMEKTVSGSEKMSGKEETFQDSRLESTGNDGTSMLLPPHPDTHQVDESSATGKVDGSPAATEQIQTVFSLKKTNSETSISKTSSVVSLTESVTQNTAGNTKQQPSRVQSFVSSQGSMDSDHLGYDAGISDSESDHEATVERHEQQSLLMPNFWLIVKILQDRVEVYSHTRNLKYVKEGSLEEDKGELPEYLHLHQAVVKKIGEICRVVNQYLLLQDLHDSHVCNSLLVAESEEDIWKNETPYNSSRKRIPISDDYTFSADDSYQPRDYLAATMHFMPGHFACDVVWRTIIQIHPRLKMGPSMGVARAIQALRSVLTAFSVVNRKNMFVYQEHATKAVFYIRLSEITCTGKLSDGESNVISSRSLALTRSQEPIYTEDMMGSRMSLETISSHSSETSRPVGQVDKHILLMVHGVGEAGPEIKDEFVKVLKRRLDEATLDIITLMLGRNCKLTPADVEFIQPPGAPPTELLQFIIPQVFLPWMNALAHYLRQNLLIFLHTPKYTDSNMEHHFQHYFQQNNSLPDSDIFLYNKPGGQGTGGKGIACIALSFMDEQKILIQMNQLESTSPTKLNGTAADILKDDDFENLTGVTVCKTDPATQNTGPQIFVRFDIWEQGNTSMMQLTEKLRNAVRHALCDVIMEFCVLQASLCVESGNSHVPAEQNEFTNGILRRTMSEARGMVSVANAVRKNIPAPLTYVPTSSNSNTGNPESVTPTSKTGRRSFWDKLSKSENAEIVTPKTTDDIVLGRSEEGRARRRHKTENVKQPSSQERIVTAEMEQAQRQASERRKRICQLEEGDRGNLYLLFSGTCQRWIAFMNQLGCPSIQQCSAEVISRFLIPSVLTEIVNLVTSLANDTAVKVFEKFSQNPTFVPYSLSEHHTTRPGTARHFILIGRNFQQWRCSTEQAHKGFQQFEAVSDDRVSDSPSSGSSGRRTIPRQRFLIIDVVDRKLTLSTYNWSVELGASLKRGLTRLLQWQNARSHVVHCLLSQKMGLFHHYCFSDSPGHEDLKQEPNPFLNSTVDADTLIRSTTPPPSKEQGRLSAAARSLPPLHFPHDIVPFDEALRDITAIKIMHQMPEFATSDPVVRHGMQYLEIKNMERKEMEKQLKIENLFVTWQQRSAQSNMPITVADLDTLKQSSRLVHYCATPLLFDPAFRQQIQEEQQVNPEGKKRHRSNDSSASGRDRSHSCDSVEMLPCKMKEEPWLLEISNTFMQQYIQYLQSMGFILVQVRPPSPNRSSGRIRALASYTQEGRASFSYSKQKSEESPKSGGSLGTVYHLQRALPGGIVLMELAFQGCYFCVKQYALECSRIPVGQTVNSQLSMLFTEECDKVRDLMHVHSFSYDFHLRVVHQYLVGCHMSLRQGYNLTSFLEDFIAYHPDIPKFGRNHVFQGTLNLTTNMITAHQLYNYMIDHAGIYGMKPLRISKTATSSDAKKGAQNSELHEYALVAHWNSSGSYKDTDGLRRHGDFDVSLLVCHAASAFEEQSEMERAHLQLCFYVIMTSQRELFPRLTADMRRFKRLPRIHREPLEIPGGKSTWEKENGRPRETEVDSWDEGDDSSEFYTSGPQVKMAPGLYYASPLFPLLASEVTSSQKKITLMVHQAKAHCRRDILWQRLFLGEHLSTDKLKMNKLSFAELEELLNAVESKSISDIDPQLECFITMSTSWYQSLIKVLLNRFPQSCRHFTNNDNGIQYLAVLNQKFIDCFVLVFLDSLTAKTNFKVVFREPLPPQPPSNESPLPQLVSMYHHLEAVINTACFNLWIGLL